MIPDEVIQRVRDRVDIVALVSRFVSLKPAGRSHKGLCPFHDEKTPSFIVNPDRGTFKCFGCDAGGSAFTFLMRVENLTFPEVLRQLAAEHGIEVPETGGAGERGLGERIARANELAQSLFRRALAQPGNPAVAYLERREIPPDTVDRFGIGFAPDRWDSVADALRREGIPAQLGERAGLLAARRSGGHYDRLRGRVTFPIRDVRGRIVGFGGRALAEGQEPKYLNTPESPLFRKREAFFGLPDALEPIRRAERAVVVEGYFDLVALQRAGVENALATCGTALSVDHARNLRRRTRDVVLLFDGDEAGQRAMERALEVLLPEGLRVHAAVLPAGFDPDDFLAAEGAVALRELVDAAPPAIEIAMQRALARGCASPAEKADAVSAVVPLLSHLSSPVERAAWEERLALAVGVERRHVEAALRAHRRGGDPAASVPVAPRAASAGDVRKLEQLARVLVEHPWLGARVADDAVPAIAPGHPLVELVTQLVSAAGQERSVDLEELSSRLSPPAASLLWALSVEDSPPDEAAAERTVDDMNHWMKQRERRDRQRALTARMRAGEADTVEILREKQRDFAGAARPESEGRSHPPPRGP
jgi:DNA primase